MKYDIDTLRQVTPVCDEDSILHGAVRFEFADGGVEIVEGMSIYDFLNETKHLRSQ